MLVSLKGDRSFRRLRKGRSGGGKLLSLRWRPNRAGEVRVGIVVSKKVGIAVIRNRVRRRLREILRGLVGSFNVPDATDRGLPSFDLIVIARPEAAQVKPQSLQRSLLHALKRGGLL